MEVGLHGALRLRILAGGIGGEVADAGDLGPGEAALAALEPERAVAPFGDRERQEQLVGDVGSEHAPPERRLGRSPGARVAGRHVGETV